MSEFLDFDGLSVYDKNIKRATSTKYYNKDEIDVIIAGVESHIVWKDAVATYDDIATTYPYPQEGWTVTVLDTATQYRYDGDHWARISANDIPKATANNDGLMPKEMYSTVDNLGTAAHKNFTTTVDLSGNLPTAKSVQNYVATTVTQVSETLQSAINEKVDVDDIGDAAEKNYTETIPTAKDSIKIQGSWYSYMGENSFELIGNGVNDGIDLSYIEDVNNYTLSFNLANYSSPVSATLHISGTKDGEPIDEYFNDGDVLTLSDIPDEYISGSDSGVFSVTLQDYEVQKAIELEFLIYPVLHDEKNNVDIPLAKGTAYENGRLIWREYDEQASVHEVYGTFGQYSSNDLPTSTAVSQHVTEVATALKSAIDSEIDRVEQKIDDIRGATEEEIAALFS